MEVALPIAACHRLLSLLAEFYDELPDAPELAVQVVTPEAIPQPQRRLLVHNNDMTSTLARYHDEPIDLEVLERKLHGDYYSRHIVLRTAGSRRAVEYGGSRVFLPLLGERVRGEVLRAQLPLGAVLSRHRLDFRACPGAFFTVRSNELINRAFAVEGQPWLYGRCGCLADAEGRTIAEVVEVLPPG